MGALNTLVRNVLFLAFVAASIAAAWYIFVFYPTSLRELVGIVLILLALPVVFRLSANVASSIAAPYNVAEVGVTGPITRDTNTTPLSATPVGTSANKVVDQIDRANADSNVNALLVRLNTPGGEIIPSEDIKLAIERFEGPTIGYATDRCASGGYEIASGCDEFWAREGSIVGSIGVIGSRVTAAELADDLGLEYEQLTAGEYKDAGVPLKELQEDERTYLQGLIDDYYDMFVDNIAERRDLDEQTIRDTEARVFLGWRAKEKGLVDELGTREDVEERLHDLIGARPAIESFEPQLGITQRVQLGSQRVAASLGAGIVGRLRGEDQPLKFR